MAVSNENRRLVIAHNPHSSRAGEVQTQVFDKLDAAGYEYTVIEVRQAHLNDNVARLVPEIHPYDIVLSAAGDGSAHAVAHTIMAANQPGVELGFLAYGNFNDVPNVFSDKSSWRDPVKFLQAAHPETVWPLQVRVNNAPLRGALLYVTMGWTARAANRFDDPVVRSKLRKGSRGLVKSLIRLGWYYLKTRRDSLLPPFSIAGTPYKKTDIIAANGPAVARLFRTGRQYYRGDTFLLRMLDVRWLVPNIPFLISGLLGSMRGEELGSVKVDFDMPSPLILQCDGEVVELTDVSAVEVKKAEQPIVVLRTK